MSEPVERLLAAVADPRRKRVTVRADDIRMLLFAAGFSASDPVIAAMAGKPLAALRASTCKPSTFKEPRP